jgi:hypothetical protein
MAKIRQHYVPKAYLKNWTLNNKNSVYYFDNKNNSIGKLRNIDSIMWEKHTYTVTTKNDCIVNRCKLIAKDIYWIVDKKYLIKFNGKYVRKINEFQQLFHKREEWDFYYNTHPYSVASKKAILNTFENHKCYVVEDALSEKLENKWSKVLESFIESVSNTIPINGSRKIPKDIINFILEMVVFQIIRHPSFDFWGALSSVTNLIFKDILSEELGEEMATQQSIIFCKGYLIEQLYKSLNNKPNNLISNILNINNNNHQAILLYCSPEDGSFITSDNPAFIHNDIMDVRAKAGIYFPLTSQYLLFVGKRSEGQDICDIDFRTVSNEDLRTLNKIVFLHANKSIVVKQKYLGYLL